MTKFYATSKHHSTKGKLTMEPTYTFGIFSNGRLVEQIGPAIECTDEIADKVVDAMDEAEYILFKGEYFGFNNSRANG